MTAIETNGLTKEFEEITAVDSLDITVEDGEVFGFLGPNGAGKSTVINMLLGFLDPTAGSARVLGHDVETESRLLRENIGVLPEAFSPYERLSAREHIEYAADIKESTSDAEQLLDRVGLEQDAWDRPAGEYSKGMGQRLALATALVGDPELLILDEPSSGLDPAGMAEMRELIESEAASGTTVFFSSHILSEVEAVCDRVGILSGGELTAIGSLTDLRQQSVSSVPLTLTVEDIPPAIEDNLSSIDTVKAVTVENSEIHVELDDAAKKIHVIRRVDERACIRDIVSEEESLEQMFETYTTGQTGSVEGSEDPGERKRRDAVVA